MFIDPVLEAVVSRFVEILGGDEYAQMIASTLAESGREGAFGISSSVQQQQQIQNYRASHDTSGMSRLKIIKAMNQERSQQQAQESSTTSKVAKVALMTLSIFGMLTGIGGIFGGLGGLGVTSLSAFLIDNGGDFIDFFKELKEQEDILYGASPEAYEGIGEYHTKLAFASQFAKNLKSIGTLFDVSDTQKPKPSDQMVDKTLNLLAVTSKPKYQMDPVTGVLKTIRTGRWVKDNNLDEYNSPVSRPDKDYDKFKDKGTILIRTLFQIIKDNSDLILKFEQALGKLLPFSNGKSYTKRTISNYHIARILGINPHTVYDWLEKLDRGESLPYMKSSVVVKIKQHLALFSLPSIYKSVIKTFSEYDTVIDKIFDVIVGYFDVPLASGDLSHIWMSRLLKKSKDYIGNFERDLSSSHTYQTATKYIHLLVKLYLIQEEDIIFPLRQDKSLGGFQMECHELIFKTLKQMEIINDLYYSNSKMYARRIERGQISTDNRELFDILIHSLVALSKAHRNSHPEDNDYIFPLTKLSMEISLQNSYNLFNNKLKGGTPLLRTQARRLIKYLRKNIHDNAQGLHDVIYETRKSIVPINKMWYWDKYDIHFQDLYTPQMKDFFDLTLGLNVFGNNFMSDAQQYFTPGGFKLEGVFRVGELRHHIREGSVGYLIFEGGEFKLVPLDKESHEYVHNLGPIVYQETADLLNTRLLLLYELIKRPLEEGVTLDDFRKKDLNGIWDDFNDDILNEWIVRWSIYKMGEKRFYEVYYPVFYEKIYLPFMKNFELYKSKDPNCKIPEFWFWYSSYLGEDELKL